MWIAIKKLFAQLLFWLYDFIDLVGDTFRVLIGLDPVQVNEATGATHSSTLLDEFVSHTIFSQVLFSLILAGIVIAMIAGIVKTICNVVKYKTGGENKSHAATIGNTFVAIIGTVACLFFVSVFMLFSNKLIYAVDVITRPNVAEGTKYSSILFDLSVEETYEIDYNNLILGEEKIKVDEYGRPIQQTDADGNPKYKTDPDTGLYVDENGDPVDQNDPNAWIPLYETERGESYYDYKRGEDGKPISINGYREGYSVANINISSQSVTTIFGRHASLLGGFESEWMPYIVSPMVELEAFNLFTAFLVAIIIIISFIHIGIGLVKRLYDVVVLIFMLPLICGTIPLDDGARFKAWRDMFVSKMLLALGAVIAINVFFQIMPLIGMIDFPTITTNKTLQRILKLFLIGGGALCVNSAQSLISRVLGTSADESREMAQSRGVIMSGAMSGVGMIVGTKNILFGGYNRYGRPRTGIFQMLMGPKDNEQYGSMARNSVSAQSNRYSDSGAGTRGSNGFRQSAVNLLSGRGAGLFLGRRGNPDYHEPQRQNPGEGNDSKFPAAKPEKNGTNTAVKYVQPPKSSNPSSYRPNNTRKK